MAASCEITLNHYRACVNWKGIEGHPLKVKRSVLMRALLERKFEMRPSPSRCAHLPHCLRLSIFFCDEDSFGVVQPPRAGLCARIKSVYADDQDDAPRQLLPR